MKMSFVTAAMLYWSLSFRQRANMSAVFPDPTGLYTSHAVSVLF